jgi:HD-GYP domain-containing protein (c-di-GMP phosphodiesterase class II)
MKAEIKDLFIRLLNAIQAGKIYAEGHPKLDEFVGLLFERLTAHLAEKPEIVLGIVEGELAWENEIFFELSRRLKILIDVLQEDGINRIVFRRGLQLEELSRFIAFLSRPGKKKAEGDPESEEIPGVRNIRIGKLRTRSAGQSEPDPAAEKEALYEGSLDFATHSLSAVLNREEIDFLDLRFNVLNIMENFVGRHQELLNLVLVKDKDLSTFVHLLHVAVLSMHFTSKLGFPKDDVLDMGVAALFHDVGKLHISAEILKKEGKLADDEFSRMKDHPYLGSMILQDYRDALGILPAVAAFEHHLRYDLTGYPKLRFPRPPHAASLIISLCDVYDALAQKRSYKADFPPDKIHEIMAREKGTTFDPALFDRFFQVMGVWPIGSIVTLSDGRIAVVKEESEQDILRPTVEIIYPEPAGDIVDLAAGEKAVAIREALNPLGKGQEYIEKALALKTGG